MIIEKRKDIVDLKTEKITVSQAITYLSRIPARKIVERFKSNLKMPRNYRMNVLKNVLLDEVNKIRIMDETLASNINHRLKLFESYTEFQLLELLEKRQTISNQIAQYYVEDFWLMLLQVANQFDIKDEELIDLITESMRLEEVTYNTSEFNKIVDELFEDEAQTISGILPKDFMVVADTSMTISELKRFATMNEIKLPNSITRAEIIPLVITESLKKYPNNYETLNEEIQSMNVMEIKRYIKNENLDVRYDIRKETLIKIIIEEYVKKEYKNIVTSKSFNLPLRKKIDDFYIHTDYSSKNINTQNEKVIKEYSENEINSINNNVNLNMYYDGEIQSDILLEQVKYHKDTNTLEVYGKATKKSRKKKSIWKRILELIVFLLAILVLTILCILILDLTKLAPRDSNPISKFVFDLLFR